LTTWLIVVLTSLGVSWIWTHRKHGN